MAIKINKCLLFTLLLHILVKTCTGLCSDHDVKNTALVNILLDETSGPHCELIKLGAIQERAAIEYTVHSVNSALKRDGFDMKIQANILDTCSNVKSVNKVVLKALVTSEQTCPDPPLLIGFIGPQASRLLNETRKVSSVFSTLHILGNNYHEDDFKTSNARNMVESEDTLYLYENYVRHKYEIILNTLQKLNWASFTLILDDSELSVNIGNHFLTARHYLQGKPCVAGNTLILPRDKVDVYAFYKKLLLELEAGHQDGLLIIVNEMSVELAEFLRKFGKDNPTILSVNKVGVGSWRIPENNHFFLLQEISSVDLSSEIASFINKTALNNFIKQEAAQMKSTVCINKDEVRCDANILAQDILYREYDSSTLMHLYSINLLAATLKSLHRLKCKSEPSKQVCTKLLHISKADDLNTNIRRATVVYNGETIRFNMNAEPLVNVYSVDLMDNQLKLVATVQSNRFDLLKNMKLPVKPFSNSEVRKCRHKEDPLPASTDSTIDENVKLDEDTTVKTIVMSTQTSRPSIWNFIPNVRNIDSSEDYVNIAIIFISVGSAFFLFMLCSICCLWKMFRVKGASEERETYDNRSIRSVESGVRVRVDRNKKKKTKSRPVRRNESMRSARSDD